MKIGLDVGSTTIKTIVLDDKDAIIYSAYERHFSQITAKTVEALQSLDLPSGVDIEIKL